jgi:hypothetical protein
MFDREYRSWVERGMKGQDTQRAKAVLGGDETLRIELPSRISLMEVAEREELGSENQDRAEERNRSGTPSNQPSTPLPATIVLRLPQKITAR